MPFHSQLPSSIDEHFIIETPKGSNRTNQCSYCLEITINRSRSRNLTHLLACDSTLASIKDEFQHLVELLDRPLQPPATPPLPSQSSQPQSQQSIGLTISSGSTHRAHNRARIERYIDQITEIEQSESEHALAAWIFGNGVSISIVDHTLFRSFVNTLRPTFTVPTRKVPGGALLDKLYSEHYGELELKIAYAHRIAIVNDSWTDINKGSVVNYILQIEDRAQFYEAVYSEDESHSGDYFAEQLVRIGANKIIGVVTDNAANMQKSWAELKKTHPAILMIGCASHKANLLAEDIIKKDNSLSNTISFCHNLAAWF